MNLQNSTILITGGTSGIGLEFLKQLSSQGATRIIITGRDRSKLEAAKRQFPDAYTVQSDVGNPKDIEQLYVDVTKQFPALNIIINNAGIMRNLDLLDPTIDLENVTREVDTNLSGTIRMVQQFLPHLQKQTSAAIINISSGLAFIPFPLSPVYSATKAGIHAYTEVLRLQLKGTKIKVFEIAPPSTETPLQDAFSSIDMGKGSPVMKVDKMVAEAIKGILNDKPLILPGMSKALRLMSRVAPKLMLNTIQNALQKAMKK